MILFDFDSEVVLGEWKVGTDPDCKPGAGWCAPKKITRGIAEIIKHESYHGSPKYQNDISLIRLNESVPLFQEAPQQSYASPVCLPWTDETDLDDDYENFMVTGWGNFFNFSSTNSGAADGYFQKNKVGSKRLRKLKVPNFNCRDSFYWKIDYLNETTQICAGGVKGQ